MSWIKTLREKALKIVLTECYYFCNDHFFDPVTDICIKIIIFSSWFCHKDNSINLVLMFESKQKSTSNQTLKLDKPNILVWVIGF